MADYRTTYHRDGIAALIDWQEGTCRPSVYDRAAWVWACREQGYEGSYQDWLRLDSCIRADFEQGAAGLPTG